MGAGTKHFVPPNPRSLAELHCTGKQKNYYKQIYFEWKVGGRDKFRIFSGVYKY